MNNIKQSESNVNKLLSHDECVTPISISTELNVDKFISQFVKIINDSFSIQRQGKTERKSQRAMRTRKNGDDNDEKKEMKMEIISNNTVSKSKKKTTTTKQ